jgi:hypothetical protein
MTSRLLLRLGSGGHYHRRGPVGLRGAVRRVVRGARAGLRHAQGARGAARGLRGQRGLRGGAERRRELVRPVLHARAQRLRRPDAPRVPCRAPPPTPGRGGRAPDRRAVPGPRSRRRRGPRCGGLEAGGRRHQGQEPGQLR